MKKVKNIIAFLSDFGLDDHFVGTMKGVMLSYNPSATIIDISHDILPQNIRQAGYLLWAAYKFFPKGTVFVCVVDPGVGSSRKILALRTKMHVFIAPDNGLLDFVIAEEGIVETRNIEYQNKRKGKNFGFLLPEISSTFHGRDIFAPVAAYLSKGKSLRELGEKIPAPQVGSPFVSVMSKTGVPRILHVDHFGNIVTNIRMESGEDPPTFGISLRGHDLRTWARTYVEAPPRGPFLISGSNELVEIAVKNGNAAERLSATCGDRVNIISYNSRR